SALWNWRLTPGCESRSLTRTATNSSIHFFIRWQLACFHLRNAAFALRDIFGGNNNVDVQMSEVLAVDLARRTATTRDGKTFTGDYLVLATGSQVNFYGIAGAQEYSIPLYS